MVEKTALPLRVLRIFPAESGLYYGHIFVGIPNMGIIWRRPLIVL